MEYIKWDDALSVDNYFIDEQHKELFRLINEFYVSIKNGSNRDALSIAISNMGKYMSNHFYTEENMMKKAGYHGIDAHIKEHEAFVAKVNDLKERFESGRLVLSLEVTSFVKDWITNHIKVTDQKYKGLI